MSVFADVNLALNGTWETLISAELGDLLAAGALVISLISLIFTGLNTRTSRRLRKIEEDRALREQPALTTRVRDQYFETVPDRYLFSFEVEATNESSTLNSIKDARLVLVLGGSDQAGTFSAPMSREHGSRLPVAVDPGGSEIIYLVFSVRREFLRAHPVRGYTVQVFDTFGTTVEHPVTVIQKRGAESGN